MRRFLLPLLPLLFFAAAPALAAGDEAPKPGPPGTNVELEYLMAPLTGPGGKLLGYAYISPRLTVTAEIHAASVREKVPFIQDAFIRDVNAKGVAKSEDPQTVNIRDVESRLLANAIKVMGPGKVKTITVCTVQIAELHPRQTPSPTPADAAGDVDAHGNPVKSRCDTAKPA